MRASPKVICQICLSVLLTLRVGLLFFGSLIVPILPHFQLDAVLTPEELADTRTRDAVLALLRKANGNQWLFWTGAGAVATCASLVGLWTIRSEVVPRRHS